MDRLIFKRVDPAQLELCISEFKSRLGDPRVDSFEPYMSEYNRLCASASPAFVLLRASCREKDGGVEIDGVGLLRGAVCRVLSGCSAAVLMAVTLGAGVDREIMRASVRSAREGFVTNAFADTMAEALADTASRVAAESFGAVTGRFSPGYADLPLEVGHRLIRLLGCEGRLGIKLCEDGLMSPKKSINAIMGIKDIKNEGKG